MLLLLLLLSHFSRVQLYATPPGSPIPGILQARVLEWVAIAFSKNATWFDTKEIQWTSVHNVGVCVGDRRTDIELGPPQFHLNTCTEDVMLRLSHLLLWAQDAWP